MNGNGRRRAGRKFSQPAGGDRGGAAKRRKMNNAKDIGTPIRSLSEQLTEASKAPNGVNEVVESQTREVSTSVQTTADAQSSTERRTKTQRKTTTNVAAVTPVPRGKRKRQPD